ncbi:hypothetical protein DFH07DRAFT_785825 [Mycena maculata]|uniref:Uncharacterized protein n=1 Tax=Mycena maculata TaxID=230809 RepID=A0AAD7H759_9AGAR|nr:hypothetical protein DFH07DRAFT_785825 [Mycena maculata]
MCRSGRRCSRPRFRARGMHVGHHEMVWCHQVHGCISHAVLELEVAASPAARGVVLDRWLGNRYLLPLLADVQLTTGLLVNVETLPENTSHAQEAHREYLYLLLVLACRYSHLAVQQSMMLSPVVLKLILSPIPKEGSDESEGIVLFEAGLPSGFLQSGSGSGWRMVGEEWIAGFCPDAGLRRIVDVFRSRGYSQMCSSSTASTEDGILSSKMFELPAFAVILGKVPKVLLG